MLVERLNFFFFVIKVLKYIYIHIKKCYIIESNENEKYFVKSMKINIFTHIKYHPHPDKKKREQCH